MILNWIQCWTCPDPHTGRAPVCKWLVVPCAYVHVAMQLCIDLIIIAAESNQDYMTLLDSMLDMSGVCKSIKV